MPGEDFTTARRLLSEDTPFHLLFDYRTHALESVRKCSFPRRRISVCIYNVGWGALQWTIPVLALGGLGLFGM